MAASASLMVTTTARESPGANVVPSFGETKPSCGPSPLGGGGPASPSGWGGGCGLLPPTTPVIATTSSRQLASSMKSQVSTAQPSRPHPLPHELRIHTPLSSYLNPVIAWPPSDAVPSGGG